LIKKTKVQGLFDLEGVSQKKEVERMNNQDV